MAILLAVGGCSTTEGRKPLEFVPLIGKPAPVKLGDKYWILDKPLIHSIPLTSYSITVPRGFITDLASTPRILWSFGLSPIDSYMAAAIVHDYLYWDQRCSKKEADNVLRLGMLESNVSPVQQYLVYGGVLAFGSGSWKDNAKLKASGESRFFSESYTEVVIRAPQDRLESLKRLQDEGRKVNGLLVLDDSNPDIVNACRAATAALQ